MYRRSLILFVALLAAPLAASAQPATGPYLSVAAGFNKMQQEDVDARLGTVDVTGEVLTSIGPALSAAFGVGFHHGLRLEAEGNYLSNRIKGETGLSGEDLGTGTERKFGVMGNVLYEIGASRVRPYVGAGAGVQYVHEPDAVSSSGGVVVSVNGGTQGSFAYQIVGGAAFPINKRVSITADYRFLGLAGERTYTGTATVPGLGTFDLTDTSSNDKNHTVAFGVRLGFGS
jgi:opacity protein-like surface antigen